MSLNLQPYKQDKFKGVISSNLTKKEECGKTNFLGESTMGILFQFAKRYISGRTLEEALPVVKNLNNRGFHTTMDNLGEEVSSSKAAAQAVNNCLCMIDALKENDADLNISVKLTQIGLAIDPMLCRENLKKILEKAQEAGVFVRVDMEGSDYTSETLDIVRGLHARYPNIGTVLQSMLYRTKSDADGLVSEGVAIRLCKGAYKEPPDIAFPNKKDVDKQYVEISKKLITSNIYHGIATHDEKIINELKQFVIDNNISKDKFEFQMLLGIRPTLQQQLVDEGWQVRVYVPFGRDWLPYTIRRMRERKENFWFVVKNIFRK